MRAVFCHDNIYRTDSDGNIYSEGQFESETWARYLQVFDQLTVVGRVSPLDEKEDPSRYNISERDGVNFHFVPDLAGPVRMFSQRPRVAKELSDIFSQSDAVIVRGAGEIAQLAARLAGKMGKPVAAEVVGCAWDSLWNYGSWQGRVFAPINFVRTRRMIAKMPFAIYVSQSFLQRRYPCYGNTAIASNVNIAKPDPAVLQQRLSHIQDKSGPFIIGMIGSLKHQYKGVHIALKALAENREKLPPFEFRILGNGDPSPWQQMAQELGVAEVTHFCGTLPSGKLVLEWLDDIDLYIQPSFQEGVPRAMIEAMSRGCPALGSSAGGIGELLSKDFLHKPGDYRTLGAQLVHVVNNKNVQLGSAGKNFDVSCRYSADVLSERRYRFWKAFSEYATTIDQTRLS